MTFSDIIYYLHDKTGLQILVQKGGIPVMSAIVFAETGLLVGFFLPGDSMLFLAGMAASALYLNIYALILSLAICAVLGNQMGYFLGSKCGPAIFSRKDGRLFRKEYAVRAHDFYVKNGAFAVILARFVPVLRTFVPFVAGVAKMSYWKYLAFDCIGGPLWIMGIVGMGYFLGQIAQPYLGIILPCIIILSITPLIIVGLRQYFAKA